jgi:GST-like protein
VKSPEFLSLNPNNKIPAIIDPDGPDGAPIALVGIGRDPDLSCRKDRQLLGTTAADRYQIIKWLMFQMGGVGPMFGQLGFFVKFAGAEIEDPRPRERYIDEARAFWPWSKGPWKDRTGSPGSYSIADIALGPWLAGLEYYEALEAVGWHDLNNTPRYVERF